MLANKNTGGPNKHGRTDKKQEPSGTRAIFGRSRGAADDWSTVRKLVAHNDAERRQQGVLRTRGNVFTTVLLDAHTSLADDDKKPIVNFSDDFEGDFVCQRTEISAQ